MNRITLFLLALVPASLLAAGETTVIRNATVLTVTKGTFQGSILIRDGKIVEAGEKVLVPEGAKVIDAGGQFVMPGIIDCHSHIAADSINEGAVAVSSMVGIEDVLNPDDIDIYRALAGGVTTANILHGSANPIGGKCQVIKTRWGKDAQGLIFEGAMPGIKFALGENPKRAGNPPAAASELPRAYVIPPPAWAWRTSSGKPLPRRAPTKKNGAITRPNWIATSRRSRRAAI